VAVVIMVLEDWWWMVEKKKVGTARSLSEVVQAKTKKAGSARISCIIRETRENRWMQWPLKAYR